MSFSRQPIRQPSTQRIPYRRATSSTSWWGKVLFLLLIITIFSLYAYISVTGNLNIPSKTYDIEKGMTVSELNEDIGLWVAPWRYRLWLRFFANAPDLQVGQYVVASGTTLSDFFTKNLKRPTYTDTTITILPWWNLYDIDAYLANKWVSKVGDFLSTITMNFWTYQQDFPFLQGIKSLEGFLYPDTYHIRPKSSMDEVVRILLSEWEKKIWTSYEKLGKDAYNTLILASIVEREERNRENQPIVAGILKKRFDEGMPIGADATVCYGYAKTHKECTPSFIASVIADKNTYNTRSTRGYPPTPISSISLTTWNATSNPQNSSFYYYLHDNNGLIHYAKTLEEHVENKKEYLQ
jgi:UPF0755 protein